MAMPLTGRNLSICSSCNSCVMGGRCRYLVRRIKIKFTNPIKIKLPRIIKPKRVKVPEEIKFITHAKRIGAKARRDMSLGKIIKPDSCQRCGKAGKVDMHHPNYNDPDNYEFLCRSCHIKAKNGEPVTTIELSEPAKQRRLKRLEEKYGEQIKNIFMDFHNQPELRAVDLAELIGISRERVRQYLIEIHGKSNSPNITNKCRPIKTASPYIQTIFSKLITLGHEPEKIRYSEFLLKKDILISIKKVCYHKNFRGLFFHNYFKSPLRFVVAIYNDQTYVFPLKKLGRPTYYFKTEQLPQYENAWHLLTT